ncbi:TetR family transcriptional regulator [Paractinoplanes abujensis]|uniref:AcrR family transcriptional regulator n=1 Tax=Paractinoplanes abujensis TaxID=882441 RepID=A0A7W7FXX8_9ACTN|nr:TetR family transcriptional regulator [Actinoplanes abujensis]MBB4690398.1 AcrR family transcriptional regulator [Actinoplanes abujensis]GID21162.1 TetR family transcriptional regulator [Actinoplanes abujensis]
MSLREAKRQRVREQLVEAAFALYAEHGFAQVSVTDIAERAQVGRTTFFRYFGDKQEVLFAGEQRLIEEFAADSLAEAPPPRDLAGALSQLWGLAYAKRDIVVGDRAMFGVRQRLIATVPELQDRANRKMQRIAEALETTLVRRKTDPEVALLAAQIGIACFRVALQTAGEDPKKVMPAMERVVRQVISTASPSH